MLGPADIQKLATIIDPERDFMEVGPVEEVDVDHLDYDYVKGCENVKELVELLNYLKAGKAGFYPDLEVKIQEKLAELDPVHHPLPLSKREEYEEKEKVNADLASWAESFPAKDGKNHDLKQAESSILASVTVSGNNIQRLSNFAEKNNIKTIDSLPFNQFDLGSDVEHAHSENFKPLGSIYNGENEDMVAESLTIRQREKFAENEKNKGNDCLRASELSDALLHYTTSLKLIPSVAVFNNRALCNLKLKNYENAIKDCTSSLELEVSFKAFLRRSSGYCSTGLYQKAIEDIDSALEMDPESKEALLLRKQIVEKCMADKETSITQTRNQKTKIFIEEVENGSPVPQIQEVGETATSMKTKLNIIEVEDEESEDDF